MNWATVVGIIAVIVGWCYALLWSVSFWFQTWHNFRRLSVIGFSFSYLSLNLIGFTYYSIYNCTLCFSKRVQDVFNEAHPEQTGSPVDYSDVFFSLTAWLLTVIQAFQVFVFPKGGQAFSPVTLAIDSALVGSVLVTVGLAFAGVVRYLVILQVIGIVKMISTILKFTPQAFLNFRRKNTGGWAIRNVTTDFTGGWLALLAMFLTALSNDKWAQTFSNFPKIGLSVESIAFDTIFMFQHWILYRKNNKVLHEEKKRAKAVARAAASGASFDEEEPLLPDVDTDVGEASIDDLW